MIRVRSTVLIPLAALLAGTGQAQMPPPVPPAAATPPAVESTDAEIIVRGAAPDEDKRIGRAVQAIGRPVPQGGFEAQYARWDRPVCVTVAGLDASLGQFVADRIGQVADEIGVKAEGPGCQPNIYVVVTNDVPGFITASRDKRAGLLNALSGNAIAALKRSDAAVRWAATSGTTSARGDIIHQDPRGGPGTLYLWQNSLIKASTKVGLIRMTVMVDAKQAYGVSARQLADYLAMVSLAQLRPNPAAPMVNTILALFPQHKDATPPDGLTAFDLAYLKALYRIRPADHGLVQQEDIAARVRKDLATAPTADTPGK